MRSAFLRGLSRAAFVMSIGLAANAALAQEAETPDETQAVEEAAPAAEAPTSKRPSLDEVIVTAQRREQNIKEVPISITAIGEQQMQEMDMTDLNDLNRMAPTINVGGAGVFNAIYIRGLGSGVNWGVDQAVGIFIDDVYYTGAEKLSTSMMDISGIEILRGPQGSLFGRNTIAGAILIHTGDPENDWAFAAEGNFGERDRMDANFMANVPIWDEMVAGRLAFRKGKQEGMIYDRLAGHGARGEMRAVRGKLRFTPNENVDIILSVMDQKGRSEGTQTQYWNIQDEHLQLMKVFDPESEGDLGDYRHSADTPDGGTEWQTDYSVRATVTAADHDFIFIANISDQKGIGGLDIDYGPIPLLRGSGDRIIDQSSLEFRAVSNFGDWFEYVAGLYYFHGNRLHNTHITLLPVIGTSEVTDALIPALVGGVLGDVLPPIGPFQTESFYTRFDQVTDSYSAYGQITADIIKDLTLIVGARYSIDQKSVDFIGTATGVAGAPTPALLLNYSLGVEDFHLIDEREDRSFDPKLSVVYHLNEETNIYGTVATGYKNGGFNAQAWTSSAKLSFEPETSISYEAGVKSDIMEGAGRLSVAVFRSEFEDLQASIWDGTTFIVDNAASVVTQGVEIESQAMLPWDIFTIASFAYLDAKYESFEKGPCVAGSDEDFCDVSGARLPSPEFQAMASVNYVNVLGNLPLDFFVGVDANWQSKVQFATDGDPLDSQDAYAMFNARLGVMGDDQNWNFMIYVRNLEDKVVKRASFDATLLSGTHVAYVHPPRTFSAHFSVNF